MVPRALLVVLIALGVMLPIAIVLTLAMGQLLAVMDDLAAARWLRLAAVPLGIAWAVDLVGLVLAMAFRNVNDRPEE